MLYMNIKWIVSLSVVYKSVTSWTVALQAPLSMEFSSQEYSSELPFPSLGNLPDQTGVSCIAGRFFTIWVTRDAHMWTWNQFKCSKSTWEKIGFPPPLSIAAWPLCLLAIPGMCILQHFCLENPMNSMKRQNDRILKEELLRLVGAQYATGDQWRNNSRKNEGM